jgi:hypothetical protein
MDLRPYESAQEVRFQTSDLDRTQFDVTEVEEFQ